MNKFLPYLTNDYSVGLYNNEVNDIYHSACGALTEAYEKFINPLKLKDNLRVLDICYGIGYNTKALLNECINKGYKNICIDCVDIDSTLIKLSPFIKTYVNLFDRIFYKNKLYKNILNYKEANKIINDINIHKHKSDYKISKIVNLLLYRLLSQNFDLSIENFITEKENFVFFDKSLLKIHKNLIEYGMQNIKNKNKSTFLHNIYYQYISKRYLNRIKEFENQFKIKFYVQDVRDYVKNSNLKYDIVLLDGFTPNKCPCIWSQDFFERLYELLNDDGQLVTYNTSAVVRSAMFNAKFNVGNIKNSDDKIIGTFASKNISLIKNHLSKKQLGLLSTKAGIPFRDKNLQLSNDEILSNRLHEQNLSTLESSSKYLKRCKHEV